MTSPVFAGWENLEMGVHRFKMVIDLCLNTLNIDKNNMLTRKQRLLVQTHKLK